MSKSKILYFTGLLILVVFISGFSISNQSCNHSQSPNPPIEYDHFDKDWKKVDSLISAGLPKSALEITEGIYSKAKEDKNHPQFIKATLYKLKLKADFEEEFIETTVADLNAEIEVADALARQLLHSVLADVYWRYYQANRYVFLERTKVTSPDLNDIQTWDLKTLLNAVVKNYMASLENKDLLLQANLYDYDVILETAKGSKKYRPTLYDFLAHRAVDFFINDESSIVQPAYKFELDKEDYFSNLSDFNKLKLETKDSLSLKFYALQILQDLTTFHKNDKNPTALVDANLKRLDFVHRNATMQDKDSLYLNALINFEKSKKEFPVSADISYLIARAYFQKGQSYNPLLSGNHKWEIKMAAEKCQHTISEYPETDGAKNCKNLLAQIQEKHLQLTIDYVNTPDKPFLGLLGFKNIQEVSLRIVKLNYEENREIETSYRVKKELVRKYTTMNPMLSWSQELPDDGDMQIHSAEMKLPALNKGFYIVLASSSESFDPDKDHIVYQPIWISNISYISQDSHKGESRFYTLNRESGSTLKNVNAQLFYRNYDYRSRSYDYQEGGNFTSDATGYFEIPALESGSKPNSYSITFSIDGDTLVTNDHYYRSPYTPIQERIETKTWFFTDRAIYRPGQTVYFKGIILEKTGNDFKIKPKHKTTIELFDANYQKVSDLQLISNEYGTVNGSFTAPQGGLNGRMTIRSKTGSVSITVEEYKRPKFEVEFNPIEGSYKLNEVVTVKGSAKAFAGNNISSADVKYRVVRETSFPWRFDFWGWFPNQPKMEITNGLTKTDENGFFSIDFTALPDNSTPQRFKPVFSYTVYAVVTDINGETQSSTTTVRVSYIALEISLGFKDLEAIESFNSFVIKTRNLNGQPIHASGEIVISKLQESDRLVRERNWSQPDLFLMDKASFINDFPFDAYSGENNPDSLKVESVIKSMTFDTKTDSVIYLSDLGNLKPGRYLVEASSKDGYGEAVEYKKYVILFSESSKTLPVKDYNWFNPIVDKCEPGESAKFAIGSADKNVHVLYEIAQKDKIIKQEWIKLSNEQKIIEFPVLEEHRGGLTVNVLFVKQNRSYTNSLRIEVPFTNKELDFEFITFRNKLIPGQKEKWTIKLKGKNGDKIAAEILASMYDGSLDKFVEHNWSFSLFQSLYGNLSWNSNNAFSTIYANSSLPGKKSYAPVYREYDRLNWFGFNYYGGGRYREGGAFRDGMVMEQSAMPGEPGMNKDSFVNEIEVEMEESVLFSKGSIETPQNKSTGLQVRRDFRETAFFFPTLNTNEEGEVEISFTVPESLTKWKLMGLAHTKDLKYGQFEKEIVTRKDLMIVPNAPRFFRQGDKMTFSAKVVNMSENSLSGTASLQFIDTRTNMDISKFLIGEIKGNSFEIEKGASQHVEWEISIPEDYDVISYRILAKSGNFSDGEEKPIPVLSNRMLVTESLPMPVKGMETKKFKLKKLITSGHAQEESQGQLLKNHKFTLEFSSNPAWYAVQALPYMMEGSVESADNIFNRFYANTIASYLVNSNPKIKQVFDTWKNFSADALISNLEKNEELKSLILNETPWVRDAQNETERKQRIAVLFDLNKMADEKNNALRKLVVKQLPAGGFPWFKGMRVNRYVTQQIVTGFGHLKQLGIFDATQDDQTKQMIMMAVNYLDQEIYEDYNRLLERAEDKMNEKHIGSIQIQYLYARSYFSEIQVSNRIQEAFNYYKEQSETYWTDFGIYQKGMIALALDRFENESIPEKIMKSVKEFALYSDEMGMYWRANSGGYYWYEAPIETQALLIEAFDEILDDKESVEQMKIWLLKQKQTQDWETPKATAEAVYALLLRGSDWLANDKLAIIEIGDETIDPLQMEDTKVEAGTGYFKTSWSGKEVKPSMGNITVTNQNESIAWGAVYWQYFEDLDRITYQKTPLSIVKKLFIENNTDAGPVLEAIEDGTEIKVGNKVIVRIEIRVDRDMEFVHMKDMRASAFEPINVLSGYRYKGGLGYYETTLDASTNFFFDYLRKGTYVFEYPMVASQKGDFSNGITTIQCMYAPEFTSHSEGVRVIVE